MVKMKKLIDLAQKIEDVELRKKVVELIKNPKLTNKDFKKYQAMKIEDAKTLFSASGPQGMQTVERDVLNHTIALTELCIKTAETLNKNFKTPFNMDHLIAAALVHDIGKLFEHTIGPQGLEHTGILLDHTMLGVGELYARDFPEGVIHIVASHFGEHGPTPPRNFEALILHSLDNMLSIVEFQINVMNSQLPTQLMMLDEETIKKLGGQPDEKSE